MADRVEVPVDAPVAERVAARDRAGVVEELGAHRATQRLREARDQLRRRRRPGGARRGRGRRGQHLALAWPRPRRVLASP